MAPSGKKYQQPYSSRHVTQNTRDPIRSEEPPYIRNFPWFLHLLYKKQTPYSLDSFPTSRQIARSSGKSAGKSGSARSPQLRRPRSPRDGSERQKQQQQQQQQHQEDRQQSAGFKTFGTKAKSPTAISAVPSDFEHIFHYSETQT